MSALDPPMPGLAQGFTLAELRAAMAGHVLAAAAIVATCSLDPSL